VVNLFILEVHPEERNGRWTENDIPIVKIAEKAVWRSVFLTIWHYIWVPN